MCDAVSSLQTGLFRASRAGAYKYDNSLWAARYNTWLLIALTPKGVVFSFLFFSMTMLVPMTVAVSFTTIMFPVVGHALQLTCQQLLLKVIQQPCGLA